MIKITPHASLLAYNTFGMDVKAALLAEYDTIDELKQILERPDVISLMEMNRQLGKLPFWHIGQGSNLLFQGDYEGVVLHCNQTEMHLVEDTPERCLLEVAAGTVWDDVCAFCVSEGLYGAENLSVIPGETGAAAVQNIGAYGVEIKDLIHEVICLDIESLVECRLSAGQMQYGYRHSLLKETGTKSRLIVTRIILKLQRTPLFHLEYAGLKQALPLGEPTLQEVREAVIRIREGKLPDPKVLGNAGSFFKNPVVDKQFFESLLQRYPSMPHYVVDSSHTKIPAGWLIEQCGWKGKSLGKAGVYEKQSLVLVNLGGANPQEILALCQAIRTSVAEKFGIVIEPEVNII